MNVCIYIYTYTHRGKYKNMKKIAPPTLTKNPFF